MNCIFSLTVATAFVSLSVGAAAPSRAAFGVGASDGTIACVAFPSATQSLPIPVRIILPDTLQRIISGVLTSKMSQPCTAIESADLPGLYFLLRLDPGSEFEVHSVGIVIVKSVWSVTSHDSEVRASCAGHKAIAFRSCTSNEGVHLTAWGGTALKSRRLWHEYVHLNYEVEPSCTAKDY